MKRRAFLKGLAVSHIINILNLESLAEKAENDKNKARPNILYIFTDQQFSEAMVDYLSLYLEQIKDNRNPTNLSEIVGVEVQMGPIPWGAEDYWAVDITLTVKEIL